MRNTDERVAAVQRRAKEIERHKRLRRGRIIGVSSAAACLLVVGGLSFAMPGIIAGLPESGYQGVGTAASIFYGGGALGYVLIGLLAFALGASVTILCYRLHQRNKEDGDD